MKKSILIQSPAKFYDAVPIFYKEWNDFGFFDKFYIVTDYRGDYRVGDNCEIIKLKRDLEFCSNMIYALPRVKEDIFMVCCEDHIRKDGNDISKWNHCFDKMLKTKDMGFLRLTNTKGKVTPKPGYEKEPIFPIFRKYKYYISLQPSFWRREYFECTLKGMDGHNAWKYERGGMKRARHHGSLISYCSKETVVFRTNFFKSGEFYRGQFINYALKHGIDIDKKKKVMYKGDAISVKKYISIIRNK